MHVLLLDVQMAVLTLVERVEINRPAHFLESELGDLLLVHIDDVEHLDLVGIQFDAKGDRDLDFGVLGET